MTLTFDLWGWKSFQQCSLIRRIVVASFICIILLSAEISRHAQWVLTDNRRTDGRTTRKHNALRLLLLSEAYLVKSHYKLTVVHIKALYRRDKEIVWVNSKFENFFFLMADFIYLQCVQKINRDQNVFRNIFCKTQTIPMKFVHRFPNKVAKKGVFLPHYLNMSLHYLVKLEMLIGHVLPLSCYREKLQSLFHLNCSPQICQIWIQLITACGDYCKARCTKYTPLIRTNWNSARKRNGPSCIMSSLQARNTIVTRKSCQQPLTTHSSVRLVMTCVLSCYK